MDRDLTSLSEEELKNEENKLQKQLNDLRKEETSLLNTQREIEEIKKMRKKEKNMKRNEFILKNKDVLLQLIPQTHDRNSCSDEKPHNDYMEHGYPRCKRCMLLHLLSGDYSMDNYEIELDFNIKEI